MHEAVKQAIAPFRIMAMVVVVVILIMLGMYTYSNNIDRGWLYTLAKYTGGDLVLICKHEDCKYIEHNGTYYTINNTTDKLTQLKDTPNISDSYIGLLTMTKTRVPGYDITVYRDDHIGLLRISMFAGLPLLIIVIIATAVIVERRFIRISEDRIEHIKDTSSLESNLKMLIAATAHHEMLTPIAVIKASINSINSICFSCIKTPDLKAVFDILEPTIDRLESVLNQMSADRKIYKGAGVPLSDIVRTTLNSLQVLYTELNFKYEIESEYLLTKVRNYKLDSGTVSNIFNNLFRNSLEAGASIIRVTPIMRGDTLEILVLDNGNGISMPLEVAREKIFKLGYSDKHTNTDLIDVNKRLNTGEGVRGDGLYLVRAILDSAGGSISLVRTSNKGTVFKLVLPVKNIEES